MPSVKPTSSFLPSGVAPMMTRMHSPGVLEPRLQMDAVGPEVDVALGRQVALLPARMLLGPHLLEAGDGRRR